MTVTSVTQDIWLKVETYFLSIITHRNVKFQLLLMVRVPTVSAVHQDRMRGINEFLIFHFCKSAVYRRTTKIRCTKKTPVIAIMVVLKYIYESTKII